MSKRSAAPRAGARIEEGQGVAAPEGRATHTRRVATSRRARQEAATRARRRMALFGGVPLAIVIVLVAVLIITSAQSAAGLTNAGALNPGSTLLGVGTKAPGFALATVDGTKYSLSSYRGRPVLLEFFAVWCPHCQREASILNQIDRQYGPKGLQTLAVLASPYGKNYDNSGGNDLSGVTKSDITWFEGTYGVTHPTLIDPNFGTVNAYNAGSYPTIYVLDRHGIIRYANSGEQTYAALAAAIDAAAAK